MVGGATQGVYAASYGNGVYHSTNGGATWTKVTGGPTDVEYAAIASNGVYYAVNYAQGNSSSTALWKYSGGAWTKLTLNGTSGQWPLGSVAIDPSNPNEIVAVSWNGAYNVSYNGGATWSDWYSPVTNSTDIPWLAQGNGTGFSAWLSTGGAAFNPLVANQLIISAGTGVWNTSVPTSGNAQSVGWLTNFYDQSAGIENLVANKIIVPPGGNPVLASWDRPFFEITNPNAYPSTYGPVASTNIVAGWSVDYASSSPSFLVGIADWGGTEESGYSTNGGQTWTKFSTELSGDTGGTIAASTPQDIVWAPAGGKQPYYTLNGGTTWNPIILPGVTSWSGFDFGYWLEQRSVTADRVLPNTFYLYFNGTNGPGVFTTTNGGASWTKVYSGKIGPDDGYNSTLMSVPGEASNLFYTGGSQSGNTAATPVNEPFYRSTNGGATWTAVPNVLDVFTFGFGAAAPGQSYPAIYIVGYVNNVYGVWQSTNDAASWTNIGTYPTGELDQIDTISGNPNVFGEVYVGFNGGGYAYLPAGSTGATTGGAGTGTTTGGTGTGATTGGTGTGATTGGTGTGTTTGDTGTGATTGGTGTGPTITGIRESPATGDLNVGKTVALTLAFSENVTVAGGRPTLTLSDGGTAFYSKVRARDLDLQLHCGGRTEHRLAGRHRGQPGERSRRSRTAPATPPTCRSPA